MGSSVQVMKLLKAFRDRGIMNRHLHATLWLSKGGHYFTVQERTSDVSLRSTMITLFTYWLNLKKEKKDFKVS